MASKDERVNIFTQEAGQIHLGGIDALVRLSLDQTRTDARRGLKTGMFISGYRGSPVGMLDAALLRQQKLLLEHHIHFVDGLNEDLVQQQRLASFRHQEAGVTRTSAEAVV